MTAVAGECRCLFVPKAGHGPEEYEDFAAANTGRGRFAIADGASESSYAGLWARLLVDGFLQTETDPITLGAWLGPAQESWAGAIGPGPFPWFTEAKIKEGAFASFLGLVLEETGRRWRKRRSWRAVAVGDCCLFQVRQGELLVKFPLESSAHFTNSPWLVGSRNSRDIESKITQAGGTYQPGDLFFLMTDALACWFLKTFEEGGKPWEKLGVFLAAAEEKPFADGINELRNAHELKNDDVTLLAVCK